MELYAKVLSYAIPGFVLLIVIEYIASIIMKYPVNKSMDTISSLSSGMTNTLKDLLGLSIVIVSYDWMYNTLGIFTISSPIWLYIVAFVLIDFASYWSHRFNHEYNVLWNRHIVHHSSEEYNLSCALRQSISGVVGVYFFLYIPLAIVGIPTEVIAITAPLHLFAQFWYHTRLIGKMGFLEHIFMTPSHHRVHHAINKEYLDKNYSAIFIVWDKMFGSFQEELPDVPPVYGVKRQVKTWNPFIINYQHFWLLIKDAWRTNIWWDKIRIWFMPTGWRPLDVVDKYPVLSVNDVYAMKKYETTFSMPTKAWFWFQLVLNNLILYHLLISLANLSFADIIYYSIYIVLSVFAYTSLMDKSVLGLVVEVLKIVFGLWILYGLSPTWFGMSSEWAAGFVMIKIYLILSLVITYHIYKTEITATRSDSGNLAYD